MGLNGYSKEQSKESVDLETDDFEHRLHNHFKSIINQWLKEGLIDPTEKRSFVFEGKTYEIESHLTQYPSNIFSEGQLNV